MHYNALTKDMVNAIVQNLKNHMDAPTIEAIVRAFDVVFEASKDYADSVVPEGT